MSIPKTHYGYIQPRIDHATYQHSNANVKNGLKTSDCHWTTSLFQDLKAIIVQRYKNSSLKDDETEQMQTLTKQIVEILENDGGRNNELGDCSLKYKYIIDAVQILKLSKKDFPGKENLICEVISCYA